MGLYLCVFLLIPFLNKAWYALEKKEQNIKKEQSEKEIQKTMINIKKKYGKNAILKGMNFEEGATTIERNLQIGGHKG